MQSSSQQPTGEPEQERNEIGQALQAHTRIKGWREFFQPFIVSGLAEIGHYYI